MHGSVTNWFMEICCNYVGWSAHVCFRSLRTVVSVVTDNSGGIQICTTTSKVGSFQNWSVSPTGNCVQIPGGKIRIFQSPSVAHCPAGMWPWVMMMLMAVFENNVPSENSKKYPIIGRDAATAYSGNGVSDRASFDDCSACEEGEFS